jgi:DNA-binding transcriptional ArsR family regulator
MSLMNVRPKTGPLSGGEAEPALIPESVQRQIEVNPIPRSMNLVQPESTQVQYQSDMYEVPRYSVEEVPTESDFGAETTSATVPIDYTSEVPVDIEEQGIRLAEPTSMPNFNTPDEAYETINKAIQDLGPVYSSFKVDTEKRKTWNGNDGNEAIALSKHSNDFAERLFNGEGIFGNENLSNLYQNDLGITEENSAALGGGLMLAATGALSNVKSRKYKDFIEDKKTGSIEPTYEDIIENPFNISKGMSNEERKEVYSEANEAIRSDPNSQPVMQSFVTDIQDRIGKNFSRPDTPGGSATPRKVSREIAAAEAYSLYDKGYIDIGKDKNGVYYPLLTAKGEDMLADTKHAAALYDVELRHMNVNEPLIRSQSTPPANFRFAGKQQMFAPNLKFKDNLGMDVIDAAIAIQAAVGFKVNPTNLSLLEQMASSAYSVGPNLNPNLSTAVFSSSGNLINAGNNISSGNAAFVNQTFSVPFAYSDSPYSKTIADLSLGKVSEKVKELVASGMPQGKIAETVGDINTRKLQQVNKHLSDYLTSNLAKGIRFNMMQRSPSTNRMFPLATDINTTNHSGTIRPGVDFGLKLTSTIRGSLPDTFSRVKNIANKVYDTKNKSGIAVGESIHRALWALPKEDRVLLDAMYQISKFAQDFGFISFRNFRPTPKDYIEALTPDILQKMAIFGNKFRSWSEGNLPKTNEQADLPPAFNNELKAFFEKKEWGPRIRNAIMASDIVNASKAGGGVVTLDAPIETDASQSNAFIISMLIGDLKVANILGGYFGGDQNYADVRKEYKDLRNLVSSTVNKDIEDTLRGTDEAGKKEAFQNLMDEAKLMYGSEFDKIYARGIVVAGLYGKHPEYMFTEVETMLSKLAGLSDKLDNIESMYSSRKEFLEDLCSIFSTSMKNHLKNLQGWQQVASSIASLKSAFNGSSRIKSFGNTYIDLGSSYATMVEDESNTVKNIMGLPDEVKNLSGRAYDIAAPGSVGKSLADLREMKDRLKELNVNIDDFEEQLFMSAFAGDKARKALPVVLIQSGDSFQMAAAIVYANQDNPDKEPLNVYSIHDATGTAPGSTLLMYNAYNNISPYIMAKNSKNVLQDLEQSMVDDFKNAITEVNKSGKANIGTLGKYKAMGGYFDRLYNSLFMRSRDELRGRVDLDPDYTKISKEYNRAVIDLAISFGWLPPVNRNEKKKPNNTVTPQQFALLSRLAITHSGWNENNQSTFPSLDKLVEQHNQKVSDFNKANKKNASVKPKRYFKMDSRNRYKFEKFIANNETFVKEMASNKNQIVNAK